MKQLIMKRAWYVCASALAIGSLFGNDESWCDEQPCTVGVSVLYWKPAVDDLYNIGFTNPSLSGGTPSGPINNTLSILDQRFAGAPGVRLDIGRAWGDSWRTTFLWTHLRAHGARCTFPKTTTLNYILPFFLTPNAVGFASQITSCPSCAFDTAELRFEQNYQPTACWQLRPFVGLYAARINQNLCLDAPQIADQNSNLYQFDLLINNHFSGAGISTGVANDWSIWHGLSLQWHCLAALIVGKVPTSTTMQQRSLPDDQTPAPNGYVNYTYNTHKLRPTLQAAGGFAYDHACCLCDFTIAVQFEAQYWFRQFVAPAAIATPNSFTLSRPAGDLMFYGLTARFGVSF